MSTINVSEIQPRVSEFDPTCPLYRAFCVFTGKSSLPRRELMQMLADVGGYPQVRVTADTNYLVVGDPDHITKKMQAAMDKGIHVIGEQEFLTLLATGDKAETESTRFPTFSDAVDALEGVSLIAQEVYKDLLYSLYFKAGSPVGSYAVPVHKVKAALQLEEAGLATTVDDIDTALLAVPLATLRKALREFGFSGYGDSRAEIHVFALEHLDYDQLQQIISGRICMVVHPDVKRFYKKLYTYLKRKEDTRLVPLSESSTYGVKVPYGAMVLSAEEGETDVLVHLAYKPDDVTDELIRRGTIKSMEFERVLQLEELPVYMRK